jgi:hypothetical protein
VPVICLGFPKAATIIYLNGISGGLLTLPTNLDLAGEISLDSSTDGLVVKGYLIDVVERVGRLFTFGDGCFEANHLGRLELDAFRRIGTILCLHAAQTTRLWLVE